MRVDISHEKGGKRNMEYQVTTKRNKNDRTWGGGQKPVKEHHTRAKNTLAGPNTKKKKKKKKKKKATKWRKLSGGKVPILSTEGMSEGNYQRRFDI